MAKLNLDAFSDEYKDIAPKECASYLVECLSEEEKTKLSEDWNRVGGYKVIPWWKWCLENIEVKYSKWNSCLMEENYVKKDIKQKRNRNIQLYS